MKQNIPTIAEARRIAGEALNAVGYGTVAITNIDVDDEYKRGTRFAVNVPKDEPITDEQIRQLKDRLEARSFRILQTNRTEDGIVMDAFHSIRTIGTVERTARHHDKVLIVLHGSDRLLRIGTTDVHGIDRLVLTQKGDEVVIWEDVMGNWTPEVSAFANRTMPNLV